MADDPPRGADELLSARDLQGAEAVLADELGAMTRLLALADRLLSIPDLQKALDELLHAAVAMIGADKGTIQIHDPSANALSYAASLGFDQEMLATIPPVDRDFHSTCAAAIRTGERAIASDIASEPRWSDHSETAASLDYAAAFSSPMKTRGNELQGVLTVHFRKPHAPSDREIRWADLFARLGAHLVERARADQALVAEKRQQELLLAELQHRVRNTLAVIRSIVRRTALSSNSVENFEQHLDGRLGSFARTQAYVIRDPGSGVDLELIVRDELLAHAAGGSQRVSIDGPEVRLNARQAETLGLAIHELTSNAIKHGALSSDGNRIDVTWSVDGKAGERKLHFSWVERLENRKLESPTRNGFGTELLERVMQYELDAEPNILFRPEGFSYQVQIPLWALASNH